MSTEILEIGGKELHPGFYIDTYKYVRPIGKGGMAEVLLATDPSNKEFAIKVLKQNRFKVGKRRFSREFRTLAKMHHPNVIQVDSYGDVFGHPYIAMEYVDGADLHKEIREFRDLSLADRWTRVREILIDLSKGLEHIHSHGVVHRDLKPSNILIDQAGRCIITDFGIVKELNSDDEQSTSLVGTWAYASPEQISGQDLDHRSDLYSLGIILYAMLCSRRPFSAKNLAGYSRLHNKQPPKKPTEFIPEIPTIYEDICLKLLEKSPQDRYQSAHEILIDLGVVEGQQEQLESLINQIPFFQVDICSQLLTTIHNFPNKMVIISGEEGFGKSRLLSHLELKLQNLRIPHTRIRIPTHQSAYESALALIQYIAKESGDETLFRTLRLHSTMLTEKMEMSIHHKLFDEACAALQELLQERPQVVLIDDIHLAQQGSYDFFMLLSQKLMEKQQLPLFFFMTSPMPIPQFSNAELISIEPLSKQDIESVLTRITPQQNDLSLIAEKIYNETDGIPLFLNAFIKQMQEEGLLKKHGLHYIFQKSASEIAKQNFNIPPTIRQLVKQRLSELPESEIQLLKLLAVSGRSLHTDVFLELLPFDEDTVFDCLDQLLQQRLIVDHKVGFDEYFDLYRRKYGDVLYEELTSEARIKLHQQLAEYFEQHQSLLNINVIQQIGEHYRCANKSGKAYFYLALSAIKLLERGLINAAIHNIQQAIPLTKTAKQEMGDAEFQEARLRILQTQSSIAHNRGQWQEAIKHLKTQLRYAKTSNIRHLIIQTQLEISDVYSRLGENDLALERVSEVLLDCQEHHDIPNQIEAYHQLVAIYWNKGNTQECLNLATKGLALTKTDEYSLPKAKILLSMSSIQANLGKLSLACEQMHQSAIILRKLLRKELLSVVLCNLAEVYLWRGMWMEALENAEESLRLSEETMHLAGQTQSNLIMALAELEMGYYSKSSQYARNAVRLATALQASDLEALGNFILAQIQISLDNPKEALQLLQLAQSQLKKNDPEKYQTSIYIAIANVLCLMNKPQAGEQVVMALLPHLQKLSPIRQAENAYWLAKYFLLQNQIPQAIEYAEKGDALALSRDMFGLSIKLKALLLNLSDDEQYHQSFQQLFDRLSINMPDEERSLMSDHLKYLNLD